MLKIQFQSISWQRVIVACTISQFCLGGVNAQLVEASPLIAQTRVLQFTPPPPPPDRDAPGKRRGGAGRGCRTGNQAVSALIPEYRQPLDRGEIIKAWGTTTAEHPTLWFDMPHEPSTIAALEFVLQDDSSPGQDLYRAAIVPPDVPGIISIQVPTTVRSLEVGKLYKWFLKVRLQCGSRPSATQPAVQKEELSGWVQRVNPTPTLISQLKQATPQQQVALYAQQGIWFDTLTTLGKLRLTNPQDAKLSEDWYALLQSIGLEPLAAKPLVPCCQPK